MLLCLLIVVIKLFVLVIGRCHNKKLKQINEQYMLNYFSTKEKCASNEMY